MAKARSRNFKTAATARDLVNRRPSWRDSKGVASMIKVRRVFLIRFRFPLIVLTVFVQLLSLRTALAQQERLAFRRISIEEGLSQSIIQGIIQDKRGFMWFGTEDGLNRYDGYDFYVIRNEPDNPASLSHNDVTCLREDRSGMIWMGTNNGGLNRYDPTTEVFTRYRFDRTNPHSITSDLITAVFEDRNGVLWVGTVNGLNRLIPATDEKKDSTSFLRVYNDPEDPQSLSNNWIRTIFEDTAGNLWIGTESGLNLVEGTPSERARAENLRFARFRSRSLGPQRLSDDRIRSMYQDKRGTLWVGTERGLNELVIKPSKVSGSFGISVVRYLHDPANPQSLNHNGVYAIFEDRSGVLWVGTNGGGLDRFDRENRRFTHSVNDPRERTSLSYNEIRQVYEDRSGNLWIGTYGGGISKIDRGRKPFVHFTRDPESANTLSEPIVWCIYEDKRGILWIGTHGGGLNRLDRKTGRYTHYRANTGNPRSLPSDFIRCAVEDHAGYLWLGTNGAGIVRFDRKTGRCITYQNEPSDPSSLSNNTVRGMLVDHSGTLWIATLGGGLNKLLAPRTRGGRATFERYLNDPSNANSLSGNALRAIFEDEQGILWIGTYGAGLDAFDPAQRTFRHFVSDKNDTNSLNNNYLFAVTKDRQGTIWIGTWGGGLNRFDSKSGTFRSYRHANGLPSDAVYGILEDKEGNLWLSTNKGLSKFDPRTEIFRNFDASDGLQSNEFNGGSYFKSRRGEMFFGGINGFNAFTPEAIKDNPYVPPVVITSFRKLNEEVKFEKNIAEIKEIELSYQDYVLSFEFAALEYTNPEKNRYAYKMVGLDKDWVYTDSRKRFAQYTTLPPGEYFFTVKGSNNDGVWNNDWVSVRIVITPPFWRTYWFGAFALLCVAGVAYIGLSRRMKNVRMKAELRTAHDAQMSIMPQEDPLIPSVQVSGVCVPANEVGGDFFDYLWWKEGESRIGIVVGDVSGKAMKAAMTAVMTSGMIRAEATEKKAIGEILTRVNQPLFEKTQKEMFVVVLLASLDFRSKQLKFSNAGLPKPVMKSGGKVSFLEAKGTTHPLGVFAGSRYRETTVQLRHGDVVVFCTDGIEEAQNKGREFYGNERLFSLLKELDTSCYSASQIKEAIVHDVRIFAGSAPQYDDMTVTVLKVLPSKHPA